MQSMPGRERKCSSSLSKCDLFKALCGHLLYVAHVEIFPAGQLLFLLLAFNYRKPYLKMTKANSIMLS